MRLPPLALLLLLALPLRSQAGEDFVAEDEEGAGQPAVTNAVTATKITDEKLLAVLRQIDRAARHTRTFCADYRKCEFDPKGAPMSESRGRFYLERSRVADYEDKAEYRMRFEYYAPRAAVTIIDGARLYTVRQDEKSLRNLMVDNRKLEVIFAGFMSASALREHYALSLGPVTPKEFTLDLVPESPLAKSLYQSVRLTFDRFTFLTTCITQQRPDGSRNILALRRPRSNVVFSQDVFDPAFMRDFVKKYRVKPPESVSVTNIFVQRRTNDVPCQVTDRVLTAQGWREETCWSFRTEIRDVTVTNIVVTPLKQAPETATLPL